MTGYNISLAVSVNKLTSDKIHIVRVMYFNCTCVETPCVASLHRVNLQKQPVPVKCETNVKTIG